MKFRISYYSTISLHDSVIVFGTSNVYNAKNAQYKNGEWTLLGELNHPRSRYYAINHNGMAVITRGDDFYR